MSLRAPASSEGAPFTFIRERGTGQYGTVWEAHDNKLSRRVAVKFFFDSDPADRAALAQARALAAVSSPHVLQVHSVEERLEHPETKALATGVVCELLEKTLYEAIGGGRSLEAHEARRYGLGIIDGLIAIHEKNLVHGDLHEKNIMLNAIDAKVIDPLYSASFRGLSTSSRVEGVRRDVRDVHMLLERLARAAGLDAHAIADLDARDNQDLATTRSTFDGLFEAKESVVAPRARRRRKIAGLLVLVVGAIVGLLLFMSSTSRDPEGPKVPVHWPSQIFAVSGDRQTGLVKEALIAPLCVQVRDEEGKVLSGASVTFRSGQGGGRVSTIVAVTDGLGVASMTFTLGSLGLNTVTASIESSSRAEFVFHEYAVQGPTTISRLHLRLVPSGEPKEPLRGHLYGRWRLTSASPNARVELYECPALDVVKGRVCLEQDAAQVVLDLRDSARLHVALAVGESRDRLDEVKGVVTLLLTNAGWGRCEWTGSGALREPEPGALETAPFGAWRTPSPPEVATTDSIEVKLQGGHPQPDEAFRVYASVRTLKAR